MKRIRANPTGNLPLRRETTPTDSAENTKLERLSFREARVYPSVGHGGRGRIISQVRESLAEGSVSLLL